MEKKMTIYGNIKGLSGSHNRVKTNSSTIGKKRMNEEEFDKDMAKIEAHLDVLMNIPHRKMEED